MKYILVTGGVISGVGKGVIASSFGTLLKQCGLDVTSIKIDPYINIDAGTFSPYEHGKSKEIISLYFLCKTKIFRTKYCDFKEFFKKFLLNFVRNYLSKYFKDYFYSFFYTLFIT